MKTVKLTPTQSSALIKMVNRMNDHIAGQFLLSYRWVSHRKSWRAAGFGSSYQTEILNSTMHRLNTLGFVDWDPIYSAWNASDEGRAWVLANTPTEKATP